jgi:hypothetical protein
MQLSAKPDHRQRLSFIITRLAQKQEPCRQHPPAKTAFFEALAESIAGP